MLIDQDAEEYARSIYGPIVARQNSEISELKKKLARFEQDHDRNARKARDFDKLIKAIKENPSIKSYWDKIMMIMKLENG